MPFNPKSEYTIVSTEISIKDFFDYKEDYVTRPPYQRKSVWSKSKKQSLMDSLFRRYYIPKLVIREVRLSDNQTVNEIIDGQQRINTVQEYFNNQYPLPKTLSDVDKNLPGSYYKDLDTDIRKFIDKSLKYQADVIKNIDEPHDVNHQLIATEIFWRLQQGETLNYMEVAHAQLSSLTRNFIVKYADDQAFDYEKYEPLDKNPFFSLLDVDNIRMKHLQFMARFLMIEQGGGYADLSDRKIQEFINNAKEDDGIGNLTFENTPEANATLQTVKVFYEILKDDPMLDSQTGINIEIIEKDKKRVFTELEQIIIYRKGKGFCQQCLRERKPEKEAKVSWSNYQADHVIPHAKGGRTILDNGELLRSYHNQSKSAEINENT